MRLVFCLLFASLSLDAQTAGLLEKKTLARIAALDANSSGILGIAAIDLQTGRVFQYQGEEIFPQASVIKIPILLEIFNQTAAGKLQLESPITLQPSDKVEGSGHLKILLRRGPYTLSLLELATAMIETSDNTATNKCIELIGGMQAVNKTLDGLGFKATRLRRIMLDQAAAARGDENVSSPMEMARLLQSIHKGFDPRILSILKLVDADIRKVVPAGIEVAAKPGEVAGVRAEAGIVFLPKHPFAVAIMSSFIDARSNPVPEAARIVYEHFVKLDSSNAYGHKLQ